MLEAELAGDGGRYALGVEPDEEDNDVEAGILEEAVEDGKLRGPVDFTDGEKDLRRMVRGGVDGTGEDDVGEEVDPKKRLFISSIASSVGLLVVLLPPVTWGRTGLGLPEVYRVLEEIVISSSWSVSGLFSRSYRRTGLGLPRNERSTKGLVSLLVVVEYLDGVPEYLDTSGLDLVGVAILGLGLLSLLFDFKMPNRCSSSSKAGLPSLLFPAFELAPIPPTLGLLVVLLLVSHFFLGVESLFRQSSKQSAQQGRPRRSTIGLSPMFLKQPEQLKQRLCQ